VKITKKRLMEIVKEEVVKEVTSDKQRRFMCAMKDKEADERPDGLSKDEAEEMCTGPMKEEEIDEGWFGLDDKTKKQTSKTHAMTRRADDMLDRFNRKKTKKPDLSPEDELQKMADEKESDKAYSELLKKMKAKGQLQEEEK
jgi:hypothetical protein